MALSSRRLVIFCLIIFMGSSCKKEVKEPLAASLVPVTQTPLAGDLLKDSVLFYTKDIYLWNNQVPASFNVRMYADPDKIMQAIRPYSIEPGFGPPVDRYSFAIKQEEWDNMSEGLSGVSSALESAGDFGLTVFFRAEGDLRVRLVEPNSPAGAAGIKRGWRIKNINGNENIRSANSDFIVDNLYEAANSSITFLKPDGTTIVQVLERLQYSRKPVYLDTVYRINNKNVGYLVFNSFLGNANKILGEFQQVFTRFASAGISDIIVDLRYNGGGYVSIQEKLAGYLINQGSNGKLMMKHTYNALNAASNETVTFKKEGSLNLSRVYFIVGNATASASELLINNLQPYMDVRLVGNTTYGKPVGFYPIPVGEWYIFPVSFRSENKKGQGNYFDGIQVNSRVADGLDRDWGDTREACLASVLRNISTGAYRPEGDDFFKEDGPVINANKMLEDPFLKITIGDR